MADLIERYEALKAIGEQIRKNPSWNTTGLRIAAYAVEHLPSARPAVDVVPVVHGRWVNHWMGLHDSWLVYQCDKCQRNNGGKTNYCPNCGAKMDGKDEE